TANRRFHLDVALGSPGFKFKSVVFGPVGAAGAAATAFWLARSAAAVQRSEAGVYTPASVAFSAFSATGIGGPAAYAGRFVIATTVDGTSFTDQYTSAGDEATKAFAVPAGIKALRVRLYLAGGTSTLLDEEVVPVVGDGATGASGVASVSGIISNAAHALPAAADGTVSSYAGSGTTIQVYEGSTALSFHGSLAPGQFVIGTPVVSPAAALTVGAMTGGGTTTANVAEHSGASSAQDVITVTYPVTVRRANGTDVSFNVVQSLTKAKTGAAGAPAVVATVEFFDATGLTVSNMI
ncbi:MAG: hypothetical protein Q8K45_01880, partial [Rubrivivax sp.]|nr:hypothetical protein [Rubrivivax sp.]